MRIHYCKALDEMSEDNYHDFREWMAWKEYRPLRVQGEPDQVYYPHHVREFLQMINDSVVEIVEDFGEVEDRWEFED